LTIGSCQCYVIPGYLANRVEEIHSVGTETVILELVRSKCMPILLYGLESCQLSNADLRPLDFSFNHLFMKLFKTNTKSIDVVKACQSFTGSEVPSCVLKRKTHKFISRFNCAKILFAIFVARCNVSVEYVINTAGRPKCCRKRCEF